MTLLGSEPGGSYISFNNQFPSHNAKLLAREQLQAHMKQDIVQTANLHNRNQELQKRIRRRMNHLMLFDYLFLFVPLLALHGCMQLRLPTDLF